MTAERPSIFGQCADMDVAQKKLTARQAELHAALDALETSWAADDLDIGQDGACRFRRFPNVSLTSVDLGRRLLDAALKETAKANAA